MRTLILLVLTLLATACPAFRRDTRWSSPSSSTATWAPGTRWPASSRFRRRGLNRVTATYSLRDDGVRVINRGGTDRGEWREPRGRAYFVGDSDEGRLR